MPRPNDEAWETEAEMAAAKKKTARVAKAAAKRAAAREPQADDTPAAPTRKKCRACNKTKAVSQFYRSVKAADGLQSYCKPCSKEKSVEARRQREMREARTREMEEHGQRIVPAGTLTDEQINTGSGKLRNIVTVPVPASEDLSIDEAAEEPEDADIPVDGVTAANELALSVLVRHHVDEYWRLLDLAERGELVNPDLANAPADYAAFAPEI